MSKDSLVSLNEICEIRAGGTMGLTSKDLLAGGVPAFGAGGFAGYLPRPEYNRPAVVLSSIGARCGKCFYVVGEWASLSNTQLLLPDLDVVDTKFLWYQLNDERRWHRSGSAQPFIKPADVKRHIISLPNIDEQRRIVRVLDATDALRVRRREALSWLKALTKSIFIEMFATGQADDWPAVTVADVAAHETRSIRTGPFGSQLLHSEFTDHGIAVLGIDNAVGNEFGWNKLRFISEEKYQQLARYTVYPGDVLITIMGTCGRAAIVPDGIQTAINTKHLCCITLNHDICVPEYLHAYFLHHPAAVSYLAATAKGAIMSGLNMRVIKGLPVSLPPIELQREFVNRLRIASDLHDLHRAYRSKLDDLFASLQDRAFKGEL